jgi:hypothetical protein
MVKRLERSGWSTRASQTTFKVLRNRSVSVLPGDCCRLVKAWQMHGSAGPHEGERGRLAAVVGHQVQALALDAAWASPRSIMDAPHLLGLA